MRASLGDPYGRPHTLAYRLFVGVLAAGFLVSLAHCTDGGTAPPDTTPVAIVVVSGDGQKGLVGTTLSEALRVQVSNAAGTGVSDLVVNFSLLSGSATLSPTTTTTSGGGQAETSVTLGSVGEQISVHASVNGLSSGVDFTVTALEPDSLELASGDGQSAPVSGSLASPLQVRVRDQLGDPLPGVTVDWAVTDSAGTGASLASATSVSDQTGVALNALSLGVTAGAYQVTATFGGLTKPPVVFSATATLAPFIASISPSPVREGFAATLTGANFDPLPANNTVSLDGVTATVTSASATSLDIVVPVTGCLPARDAAQFVVTVGGVSGPSFSHPAIPGDSSVSLLSDGAHAVRSAASDVECVQFPAQTGSSSFLVVPAAATGTPNLSVSMRLNRTAGSSTIFGSGGFDVLPPRAAVSSRARARSSRERLMLEGQARFEARIRTYERELMRKHAASARALLSARAASQRYQAAAFVVGDTIPVKVISALSGNLCNTFTTISAVVRSEGTFGVAVEDIAAPAGGFSTADYDAIVAEFDAQIYATDTAYFGSPSDLDANGRTFLVYTPEVNKLTPPGAAATSGFVGGFFFSGDLFPTTSCAQSNFGEYFYSLVPDPGNVFGNVFTTALVRQISRGTAAHEFQHLINASTRIFVSMGPDEETWLNEALSHLAEEVVGHAVTGLAPGANLDFATAAADLDDFNAYHNANFGRLDNYLLAPETVSPTGDASGSLAVRGAAWSFLRWVLDQEANPATEASITRALVNSTLSGVANLEAVVGKNFEDLVAEWLLALYADDFVAGVDGRITIPSWDLRDIYANLAGSYPLSTTSLSYAAGITNFTVLSGSGRFFVLSSGAASPAMSLRLTNQSDSPLSPTFLPRMLLLRLP